MWPFLRPLPLALLAAAACVTVEGGPPPPERRTSAELVAQGDAQFDRRAFEDALQSYEMAAVAASGDGDRGRYVEATALVAYVLALRGEAERAAEWFARAEARASEEDVAAWARLSFVRGALARERGDGSSALSELERAHAFAREHGLPLRAVQAAHLASVVAEGEAQVRWSRRAIDAAQELGDARLEAQLWMQLAWLLEERALYAEELEAFARARELTAGEDEHQRLVADWSYAHGLRATGQIVPARALLEDVIARAGRGHGALRRLNDAEWIGHAERELAEIELAEGRPERALVRLQRARASLVQAGAPELAPDLLRAVERRIEELERAAAGGSAR